MPRPPSEQGTSSLPGLATDNIGYQTASSGSDEAVTGLLERYFGGHMAQDHTVATVASASHLYSHHGQTLNSRQPPALPPGAPTAAAQGLTLLLTADSTPCVATWEDRATAIGITCTRSTQPCIPPGSLNGVVWGHSRSSAISPFDRAHTTSYSILIGSVCLSCTVFDI